MRRPSLLDAVLPLVVLAALIASALALFGLGALDGPIQVALVVCCAVVALIGLKNGHEWTAVQDAGQTAMSSITIRTQAWTSVPAFVVAAVAFAILGVAGPPVQDTVGEAVELAKLGEIFWINPLNLLPLLLLALLSMRKVPASLALMASALFAGDQYIALVLPTKMFRAEFTKRGLAPQNLSRLAADSSTVTSPLVPWNSCGAFMGAVLGVSTLAYLPFAVFNIVSPLLSVAYGFTDFKVVASEPTRTTEGQM